MGDERQWLCILDNRIVYAYRKEVVKNLARTKNAFNLSGDLNECVRSIKNANAYFLAID